jgi:hypothetical protein
MQKRTYKSKRFYKTWLIEVTYLKASLQFVNYYRISKKKTLRKTIPNHNVQFQPVPHPYPPHCNKENPL